jgi:chromosome segregation ATPase
MIYRLLVLAVLAISLGACADCTQDPSQAGFFCGIKNIAEGTYEHRQAELKSEAEQTEAEVQQRSGQMRSLQRQEASSAAEKKQLQAKLASVQADLDKQKRLLAEAKLHRQADRSKLAELETRLKALQEKRNQLGQSATASQVEALKRENQRLQDNINEVLKVMVVE